MENAKTSEELMEECSSQEREPKKQERARENALPFSERTAWRKRHMYEGWMLEPVLEQVTQRAVVTRSNYGYRVLNSADLGMVDLDFHIELPREFWDATGPQREEAVSNIRSWVAANPRQSWRVYETAAGLRMLRTDAPQSLDDTYRAVCGAIGVHDTLYEDLCVEQQAFRMRISPKPLRCGLEYPHWNAYDRRGEGWSYSDPDHTRVPRAIEAYEILAKQYKVCELVAAVGSGVIDPDLQPVLAYHDAQCRVGTALKLEPQHRSEAAEPAAMDLIAFSDEYRKGGYAPDKIWAVLSRDVQLALRHLDRPENREWAIAQHNRLEQLGKKWPSPVGRWPEFDGDDLPQPPDTRGKQIENETK